MKLDFHGGNMKAKCISNDLFNSNFTVGFSYDLCEEGIACNFGNMWVRFNDYNKPTNFNNGSIFKFAMCEFIII